MGLNAGRRYRSGQATGTSSDSGCGGFRPGTRPPPASYLEMAARAQEDPEPYLPGSFDDVTDAYDRGDLSLEEYGVLSEAVAESKRAEDEGEA